MDLISTMSMRWLVVELREFEAKASRFSAGMKPTTPVNGTNDLNHRWERLEYENARKFREQHLK